MSKQEYLERLDKIQNDLEWLIQYLLKKDEPNPIPPFVPDYIPPYKPYPPIPNVSSTHCPKCGMVFEGATSYSCPQYDCPVFLKATMTYTNPAPQSYFDTIRAARDNMSSVGDKDYED